MNYLDIIIVLALLWAAFRGFTKGFVIALASLIALIGGIYIAIHFSDNTAEYLNKWFSPDPQYLKIISFSITFLLVVIVVLLIAYLIDILIKATGLGIVNRLFGVVFNVLKMALILSVIICLFNYAGNIKPIISEKHKQESVLYVPISKIAPVIFPYLKIDNWKEKLNSI